MPAARESTRPASHNDAQRLIAHGTPQSRRFRPPQRLMLAKPDHTRPRDSTPMFPAYAGIMSDNQETFDMQAENEYANTRGWTLYADGSASCERHSAMVATYESGAYAILRQIYEGMERVGYPYNHSPPGRYATRLEAMREADRRAGEVAQYGD